MQITIAERNFSRDSSIRQSNCFYNNQADLIRGSPARNSGVSEASCDSGFHNLYDIDLASGTSTNALVYECSFCGQPVSNFFYWEILTKNLRHSKYNLKTAKCLC